MGWKTNLEQTLAAAVKLHAEADAAGLAGAGKLTKQSSEDGAGQCLLQHTERASTVGSLRRKHLIETNTIK